MAAVLTGTPTAVTWASGADPASQSITIPSDATAVYMFWTYFLNATGHALLSATLAGNNPAQTHERETVGGGVPQAATGVAVWYNPATGTQTLDVSWDAAPTEGPTTIVAYVKDGDVSAWRDADSLAAASTTAVSVTLTTVSGDLVLKYDRRFGTALPATSSGWTSAQTMANNSEHARLSYISATGSTQVCDSEDENYSSVCAISIPAAGAGYKSRTMLLGVG